MSVESGKYYSIHIPRTGGTSLRECFKEAFGAVKTYYFYPGAGGLHRADMEPIQAVQFNPRLQKFKDLILYTRPGQLMYQNVYRAIIGNFVSSKKIELPSGGSVLHGHYYPSYTKLSGEGEMLITVFRDPRARAESHYRWIKQAHKDNPNSSATYWFSDDISFEDFALSRRMVNFQARWIGGTLGKFSVVGVTEHLEAYAAKIVPGGCSLRLSRLNCSEDSFEIKTTRSFSEAFKVANAEDYKIYQEALSGFN